MITVTARPNRGMVIESKLMISQDELNLIQKSNEVVKKIAKDSNTVINTTLVDNQPFLTISQNSYHAIDVDELKEIEKRHEGIHRDLIGSIEPKEKALQTEMSELDFVKEMLGRFDKEPKVCGAHYVVDVPNIPVALPGGTISRETLKRMLESYISVYGKEESDQATDEEKRICGQER